MSTIRHYALEEAQRVGDELAVDWTRIDPEQFRMGMDVELEHGTVNMVTDVTNNDPLKTGKIALAHLNEFSDYYTRLAAMEQEAMRIGRKIKYKI